MFYIAKTPKWVRKLFSGSIWEMPQDNKAVYLTFDDGPHATITPYVLDLLRQYNAQATFFCIGKNVEANGELYRQIIAEGHAVGNHTYDHLDGWKTDAGVYLENISKARSVIDSDLFRPPYGRITRKQHNILTQNKLPYKVVMWSVLSGDFDVDLTGQQCINNVVKAAKSGAVIVFHDSEKAFGRMRIALPAVLKYFAEKGYTFEKISVNGSKN